MRINNVDILTFRGQRQDRNTVAQLKKDNAYDLNLPNLRRINEAIERLSEIRSEENIKFLLDVSNNLRYGTNIYLGVRPYNDWRTKLNDAAQKAMASADYNVREKYLEQLRKANSQKEYTDEEVAILDERERLLNSIDFKQIKEIENSTERNITNNLDYFIISSEVPLSQKLYILKKLNYLMSDEYQINSQLEDKKNQVLAEIINDIVIDTPKSDIPNSKAINQLHHGICASISICRKNLAYEDKPNYVDMVLSELDNNPKMMVYDINKLGSHTKIPIPKTYIDFKTALERGYRIVDTGAMQWMNIADTIGASNDAYGFYSPIDINFYDTFTDAHMINDISLELSTKHDYYRGLIKAKSVIGDYKAGVEKNRYTARKNYSERNMNLKLEQANSVLLRDFLYQLAGSRYSDREISKVYNDLLSLQVKNSKSAKNISDYRKKYVFVPNEEAETKKEKVEKFLSKSFPKANKKLIKSKSEEIVEIIEDLKPVSERNSSGIGKKMTDARSLYNAAAAYRTQQVLQLSVPEHNKTLLMRFNIPDSETLMLQNIDSLVEQIETGTMSSELQEKLAKNFEIDNDPEILLEVLNEVKNQIETVTTTVLDQFYHAINLIDRKHALAININYIKNELDLPENVQLIQEVAENLNITGTKQEIQNYMDEKIALLESGECSDEEYLQLFNQMGLKAQMLDFIENYAKIGKIIFKDQEPAVIAGFNALNGLPKDATLEQTQQVFTEIADRFDNVNDLMTKYKKALHVEDENGKILNTVSEKYKILEELEQLGDIPTEDELRALQRRFTLIDKYMSNKDNKADSYADLPKAYTQFSKEETEALAKYRSNINSWYNVVKGRLSNLYRDIKEPLEEHYRATGVKMGFYWVPEECHSGLYTPQEVKIIEHMTDRPYYAEENGQKAFERIRNGEFSGISSTSVDNNRPAMHAQYIADIKPVKMKNGETKYIVFHDNSWGPIEFENTWKDNNGLIRTDYAREYGGELGYITNSKYLNGNLEENMLNKVGETKPDGIDSKKYKKLCAGGEDEYKFPLLSDVIIAGTAPKAAYNAGSLMNNFLISPYQNLSTLEKDANHMTKAQIKKAMERGNAAGEEFDKVFDDMMKKINGNPPFDNGIVTLEDYNKLPKDDKLRIMLEKIAIIKSYDNITDLKEFNTVSKANELNKMKERVLEQAKYDFYYTFGKNNSIQNYVSYSSNKEIAAAIDDWVAKYGINVKPKDLLPAVKCLKEITPADFDGSMANTINILTANFRKTINKVTPKFDDKETRVNEITEIVRNILIKNNYMNSDDVVNMPNIEKWIDKNFAPTTNEEFISVFNRLRDMTTDEFKKLYDSTIDNEALGIEDISGYDILKKLRAENYEVINVLYNQIYREEFYKDLTIGKSKSHFDYNKFKREKNALATYISEKPFDEIYTDYSESLLLLNLNQRFNKWKNANYKKYGVLPAYPVASIFAKDTNFESGLEEFYEKIENNMDAISAFHAVKESLAIIDDLKNNLNSYITPDGQLTEEQYNIVLTLLEQFADINNQDATMAEVIKAINNTINSEDMSISKYKALVDRISAEVAPYEKTAYGATMDEAIAEAMADLKQTKKDLLKQLFDTKYQEKVAPILNKWIDAKARANEGDEKKAQAAEFYKKQLLKMYKKYSVLKHPNKLLEEYLLLNAKDGERCNPNISPERKQELDRRNDMLTKALTGALVNANLVELQMQLMRYKREGSLNAIAKAFQDAKIELVDGSYIPVASPSGLSALFSPILNDDNVDFIADFFNELGLNELFMETIVDDKQFDDAKRLTKRIYSILSSVDSQAKFISNEMDKLKDLDTDDNYRERIEEFGKRIIEKTKRTNYRETAQIYQAAIDDILEKLDNSPGKSKTLILGATMNFAMDGIRQTVKSNIEKIEADLKRISELERIIGKLKFQDNSKAQELADQFEKDCDDLRAYQATFPKHYPNIGIHMS